MIDTTAPRTSGLPVALDRNRIDVWLFRIPADSHAHRDDWDAWLSVDERTRGARYLREVDRTRFAIGRAGLRMLLARYLDADARSLEFATEAAGKPVLASHGGRSVHFNVSHSEELIAWAIARERAVGIDVEHVPRLRALTTYTRGFLSPHEQQVIAPLADADRERAMSEYWTLKEAYVKATGAGLQSDVTRLTFEIDADSSCRCVGGLADAARWEFRLCRPIDGYTLALCTERSPEPLDLQVRKFIPIDWRKKSTI